ncbi:MAG TPA: hypothetical protein VFF11_03750, partial [Candidatus Binatia bacterium]|nr:hypothetical protein [Candidatus Binatia bacterium]
GYFDAVGTLTENGPSHPKIFVLPNEINNTSGVGFLELPESIFEPPIGQVTPSRTLLQLRYPVNMMNSDLASQLMAHVQVKIQFAAENAPNTIKAISFKERQDA